MPTQQEYLQLLTMLLMQECLQLLVTLHQQV